MAALLLSTWGRTREDELLLWGRIHGRNEAQRQEQLRAVTARQRAVGEEQARLVARHMAALHHLQAEHASLRAIARLVTAKAD